MFVEGQHIPALGKLSWESQDCPSQLSQPFLSHHMPEKHKNFLWYRQETPWEHPLEGPALLWQIVLKSSASATELSGIPLSHCCCPELDVPAEFPFQDPSSDSYQTSLCRKDAGAGGTGSTLLDCVWRGSRKIRDGGKEKTPSHVPFLIPGGKTIFVDLSKFKRPNICLT